MGLLRHRRRRGDDRWDKLLRGQVFQQTFGLGYGGPGDDVASLAAELQADIDQVQTPSYSLSATVTQTIASAAQLTISATQLASASPIVAFVITSSGLSCSGNNGNFSSCSFALAAPGGGPPSVAQIPAVTDTGTISVVINGGQTASYTWKATDTWSAVQSGLIAAINLQYGGSLTASASNYGVQLTSKQPGYATNWPVAVSYTSSNPLGTSPAESSYSPTATNMAGGVTAGPGASAGSSYTTVVYTPGGSKLATYTNGVAASTLQAAEIPLPGGGTAMYNASGLNYLRHSDWLGSSRLATTWGHTVYAKTAYAPFGETYNTSGTDASFTGEDVDPNSGYFNFLYRKFDPVAGRWTSPDPSGLASASLANPQSLNLYAYVLNNPLVLFDPNGLDACAMVLADGTASIINGTNGGGVDCPGDGIYIETQQIVTAIGLNTNGDLSVYATESGDLYNANGTTFSVAQSVTVDGNDGSSFYSGLPIIYSPKTQYTYLMPIGGAPAAPGNSMAMDIWHCPGCENTWKQANCVVSKPLEEATGDAASGAVADAAKGALGEGYGGLVKGAGGAIKEGTLTVAAGIWAYGTIIYHTVKYTVGGCPDD